MAYRFNSGNGGVTCDECNILIDEYISYDDYVLFYKNTSPKGDFCAECRGIKKESLDNEMESDKI